MKWTDKIIKVLNEKSGKLSYQQLIKIKKITEGKRVKILQHL